MTSIQESQYIDYLAHMLDEAMCDKTMLCEDKEGKNLNKADKWVKEHQDLCIKAQMQSEDNLVSARNIVNEIRRYLPHVRNLDCKFILGATRAWIEKCAADSDEVSTEYRDKLSNDFNRILKFICVKSPDKFDSNLNGMSYDELYSMFHDDISKDND